MSEALNKFIIGKAKTRATFEKKFSGQDGALSLMEMVGDAPKGVQKQAQKIFQANADDVEKAVSEIANLAYGSGAPAKKTGIQGKTNAKPEVIEGNLPTNDTGVVADPPKAKKKGKPTAEEQSLDTARQSQAFQGEREAAMAAASEPRGQRKAAAKKELEEAQADPEGDDGELDSSIGQFVPAANVDVAGPPAANVDVAGPSFMPPIADPRTSMMVGANPNPPANPSSAGAFDIERFLSDPSLQGVGADGTMPFASPAPNTPAPVEPKADLPPEESQSVGAPTRADLLMAGLLDDSPQSAAASAPPSRADLIMAGILDDAPSGPAAFGPYRDGMFDWNTGSFLTPPADASLPGTIDGQGGFLGQEQGPTFLGVAPRPEDPTLLPSPQNVDADGNAVGNPWSKVVEDARARSQTDAAMNPRIANEEPVDGVASRPPFYDPNRKLKDWWNAPGVASRANEFMYQRGMPAGLARAIQPTASVIDKGLKVGGPLAVGGVAGYGALAGMGAIANMGQESPAVAPPTDEEQAALEAKADESMRQLQQILGGTTLRNPASAPPAAPVK